MNHRAMFYRLGSGLPLARIENIPIGQGYFATAARGLRRAKPLYAKSPFGRYQKQSAQGTLKKPWVNNSKHGPLHRDFSQLFRTKSRLTWGSVNRMMASPAVNVYLLLYSWCFSNNEEVLWIEKQEIFRRSHTEEVGLPSKAGKLYRALICAVVPISWSLCTAELLINKMFQRCNQEFSQNEFTLF